MNNILEGLVWFFIPASLVICNDVMAYVCGTYPFSNFAVPVANIRILIVGKLFGKTPLIKLSPKKTVEGFVGAFICTILFGIAVSARIASKLRRCAYPKTRSGVHSGCDTLT